VAPFASHLSSAPELARMSLISLLLGLGSWLVSSCPPGLAAQRGRIPACPWGSGKAGLPTADLRFPWDRSRRQPARRSPAFRRGEEEEGFACDTLLQARYELQCCHRGGFSVQTSQASGRFISHAGARGLLAPRSAYERFRKAAVIASAWRQPASACGGSMSTVSPGRLSPP